MFGIGPTELAFFLVIVLLAVGPDKLPTFMRTVGKGLRQVRNASREFKDAIGDPFRAPPVRPPRARPVPVKEETPPPPSAQALEAASAAPPAPATEEPEPADDADAPSEVKHP